jgi:5-methylcytosine-specific restriction endonuclease McrA
MPSGWAATRARVLQRDDYRCRRCGNLAAEAHHTVPGVEDERLIIALCGPCHLVITLAQAAAARALARP